MRQVSLRWSNGLYKIPEELFEKYILLHGYGGWNFYNEESELMHFDQETGKIIKNTWSG